VRNEDLRHEQMIRLLLPSRSSTAWTKTPEIPHAVPEGMTSSGTE
jgi:hypothetical protein